ncbi:protein phosphatase 2C [Tieghemostelium lacteum]|uniref:Protein phosphatase 2C n=1 Tax=Tieghemostelium lacteum TaxID=361077 RepID=A0A152A7Q5_TIELA|nr:protein phosphatase 2C [Tieghemostelium lacteum]|eukprot:KYR02224.1 protein phosphatase 2C [Tieghemostelium lacteum]
MVLNLIPDCRGGESNSSNNQLDITHISYSISLLDRCVEFNIKYKYKNISSLPLSLIFENDLRDLGILFHLETIQSDQGGPRLYTLFNLGSEEPLQNQIKDLMNNNYNLLLKQIQYNNISSSSSSNSNGSSSNSIELLPDKEITFISKYYREIKFNASVDDQLTITVPKKVKPQTTHKVNIDLLIECQFSTLVKNITCLSHPESVAGSFLVENGTSKSMFHIESTEQEDMTIQIQLDKKDVQNLNNQNQSFQGWCTGVSLNDVENTTRQQLTESSQPPFIYSSLVQVNIDNVNSLEVQWNSPNHDTTQHQNLQSGQIVYYLFESEQMIALTSSNNALNTSNAINTNNNVILKLNSDTSNNNTIHLQLKKTKLSSLLNRYISLHKIMLNFDNNNQQSTNSLLEDKSNLSVLKLFFNIHYQDLITLLQQQQKSSPLSQSAPDIKNNNANNNNNNTTINISSNSTSNNKTGESLSNMIGNLQKHKLPGIQSFTAPPSVMNKDLSNPIADFIAANKQGLGTSSTTPKAKKGPPPKLGAGGPSMPGQTSDIRLQRLASYNKVNQMWNLSLSDLAERHTISQRELEPYAMDLALYHVKSHWWKPNRIATIQEIKLLRQIISQIIHSNKIDITFVDTKRSLKPKPPSPSVSLGSISGGFQDLGKLLNSSNSTGSLTSSTSTEPEEFEIIKEVDPTKLKWIIENVLDSERLQFQSIDQQQLQQQQKSWFSISAFETKGNRPHMEDKHVILEYPNHLYGHSESNKEQIFFGVFDGHNGKIAAEYSKINLPYLIYNSNNSNNNEPIDQSIKTGYNQTDKYFLEMAEREDKKAGTTVATVILEKDKIHVSNVGDSEVILCCNGKAQALSTLHNPKNESEKDRVEQAGATIICYGTLRVNGILSVTRSIGDKNLKEYVISDPSYICHSLASTDQFLIMATDGLWDVFTYQEVVDFILTGKFTQQDFQNQNSSGNNSSTTSVDDSNIGLSSSTNDINNCNNSSNSNSDGDKPTSSNSTSLSERLIDEAMRRNSKDNITLIIIFFTDNYTPLDLSSVVQQSNS